MISKWSSALRSRFSMAANFSSTLTAISSLSVVTTVFLYKTLDCSDLDQYMGKLMKSTRRVCVASEQFLFTLGKTEISAFENTGHMAEAFFCNLSRDYSVGAVKTAIIMRIPSSNSLAVRLLSPRAVWSIRRSTLARRAITAYVRS